MNSLVFFKLFRHSRCSLCNQVISFKTSTAKYHVFELLADTQCTDWTTLLIRGCGSPYVPSEVEANAAPFLAEAVAKKLEMTLKNAYFAQRFRQLTTGRNSFSCWPGNLAIAFATAVQKQQQQQEGLYRETSKDLESFKSNAHINEVAQAFNYIYSNQIFQKEISTSFLMDSSSFIVRDSVNDYFTASSIRIIGKSENLQIFREFTSLLHPQITKKMLLMHDCNNRKVVRDVHEWEFECFNSGGQVAATACKSMLQIIESRQAIQELGFQFGRIFNMAVTAQRDIQQILDYGKKQKSNFEILSLPVAIHIEQNPKSLSYFHKLGKKKRPDNIDLHNVYTEINSSYSLGNAKLQLEEYVEALKIILNEFSSRGSPENLIKAVEALKYLRE